MGEEKEGRVKEIESYLVFYSGQHRIFLLVTLYFMVYTNCGSLDSVSSFIFTNLALVLGLIQISHYLKNFLVTSLILI